MKRYFGQINFEFDAEDDGQAETISSACADRVFDYPPVMWANYEDPEADDCEPS